MKEKKIFKEFKYPDGRVLQLTKKEFYQIVDVFRLLINSKRKQDGRPLLRGSDETYLEDEDKPNPPNWKR